MRIFPEDVLSDQRLFATEAREPGFVQLMSDYDELVEVPPSNAPPKNKPRCARWQKRYAKRPRLRCRRSNCRGPLRHTGAASWKEMISVSAIGTTPTGTLSCRPAPWFTPAATKTAEAIAEGPAHQVTGLYKENAVRAALEKLFHNKCAYCESHGMAGYPWDVEHYRPKGKVAYEDDAHPGYYWSPRRQPLSVVRLLQPEPARQADLRRPGRRQAAGRGRRSSSTRPAASAHRR